MVVRQLRTGWISDVHLGTRGSNALGLLQFLRTHQFETLYIVGDLIDVWSLRRGIYWPQTHNDVIQKILRAARKGTRVIYIPGNHDDFLAGYVGSYGAVTIVKGAIHITADGRRILVMHGHELDTVVQNVRWLAIAGDAGYQLLLKMNAPLNAVRRLFGLPYWSLSAFVKQNVKNAVSFISQFEEAIVRFARAEEVHGVLCGHIHCPAIREIEDLTYYNSGDWVESASAIVEQFNGKMELVTTSLELTQSSGHEAIESEEEFAWPNFSPLRSARAPNRYHEEVHE
jgi:UDP-2,3-diacylglucosamine pyrophosphatase LpxH